MEKPLKLLLDETMQSNSESSSEEDEKPPPAPVPPPSNSKGRVKGKVTPSLKASPIQPKLSSSRAVPIISKSHHQFSDNEDDDFETEESAPSGSFHNKRGKMRGSSHSPFSKSPQVAANSSSVRLKEGKDISQTVDSVNSSTPTATPGSSGGKGENANATTSTKTNASDSYIEDLLDLREKILLNFSKRPKVQEIVDIICTSESYELIQDCFTFDLCALDGQTIKKLQQCLS